MVCLYIIIAAYVVINLRGASLLMKSKLKTCVLNRICDVQHVGRRVIQGEQW